MRGTPKSCPCDAISLVLVSIEKADLLSHPSYWRGLGFSSKISLPSLQVFSDPEIEIILIVILSYTPPMLFRR